MSSSGKCSENNYYSFAEGKDKNEEGSPRLQGQLECLKKNLKFRLEQLREQEEVARDLEEELANTKMDLAALQEKCDWHERRSKTVGVSSISDPELSWHYTTLFCTVDKIEDMLRNLSSKHNCGLSNCKVFLEQEMEKIRSVKKDLKSFETGKLNVLPIHGKSKSSHQGSEPCENFVRKCNSESEMQNEKCNLIHLDDVEIFREKAVIGAAALEQMKEQIDILETLIQKYTEEFPCECDKSQVRATEEKLDKLRLEFEEISDQLCCVLQKFNQPFAPENFNDLVNYRHVKFKRETICTQTTLPSEEVLICHCQRQENIIFDQGQKLEFSAGQLDNDLCEKRCQLAQYNQELNGRFCEIANLREVIKRVGSRLKQLHFGGQEIGTEVDYSPSSHAPTLGNLFCDLEELWFILEKSTDFLYDIPRKLQEDNEKLKDNLNCLEKCVCNKEETLRVLQDTVKLRECQIEELRSKMQTSESQTSKLAQDVEEKCCLIANLQEAVRKCKQFEDEARSAQVESLEFEVCGLNEKLKKSEKEILLRDKKMESLHNEIIALSSKNFISSQELKIMEPRLKSLYKTTHLFEKMVNDLQSELNCKECEVETLYEKIKDLEDELETEFKKCEERALEDSKCIEDLSFALKSFQNELCCTQERCLSIAESEDRFRKEQEMNKMKEMELNNTICQLRAEIKALQQDLQGSRSPDIERIMTQAESDQELYQKKIEDLERDLQCTIMEHEEERKYILEKLCCEKKENTKCKTLISKLNENIKRRMGNERNLKDYIDRFVADNESLKSENQQLKTEIEARKKIMAEVDRQEGINLSDFEQLICHLKVQKAELKTRCCTLKVEVDKEIKLKKLMESRVEDLRAMLDQRSQEFNEMVDNYKNTSSDLKETLDNLKNVEENLSSMENDMRANVKMSDELNDCERLKRYYHIKTAENAKLISQLQILKFDVESLQTEKAVEQLCKDSLISQLQHEINCLETELQGMQTRSQKLSDENEKLHSHLQCLREKESSLEADFRDKHDKICDELRQTISEKNDLLTSVDELQKQLEQICLDNVSKEKKNRELMEECSKRKIQNDLNENRIKADKIINNLSSEVKNLQRELFEVRENYKYLHEEYQTLMDRFKCCEKKKFSLEKLYVEVTSDNKFLQELRMQFERELCELKTQNGLLKDKICSIGDSYKNPEEAKKFFDKIREMTAMIKTLEQRVIPNLEQEIAEKNCCIENLKLELREANISSQRIRNEALRVIQHTKKYLAAQRCANENLKSRLESSNKRGNILGAENRDLEEQLKAVTRMNEFLLCQLENNKTDVSDAEPRSFSPLPWGCPNVERDTSSSEYLAESGFQSMQPSPTNMDCVYDYKHENQKRSCFQYNNLKRSKHGGSAEYPQGRNGDR